ncbi:MAG: hypothetical protein ABSA69_08960 [Verrucomicrobiota bacterium]
MLMRGQRHHGVADLVGQPVGHGPHQAQVGGFDFQAAQLFALGEIFHHQQRGGGLGGIPAPERNDGHAIDGAR